MTAMGSSPDIAARVVRRRHNGEDGWVTRQIAGETLILPVSNHVGNLDAIYTMNEVGGRIWQLIETPMSVGAMVGALREEFEVSVDDVTSDVVEFLELLESKGLLEPESLNPS